MSAADIEKFIKEGLPDAQVEIKDLAGDGNHYAATVISSAFKGKSRVQQHQMVYAALKGNMGGVLTPSHSQPQHHRTDPMTTIHDQIDNEVKTNDVVLFMKGTARCRCALLRPLRADPPAPRRAVQGRERAGQRRAPPGHQGLHQLANHSAALREGRIRGRRRHHVREMFQSGELAGLLKEKGVAA